MATDANLCSISFEIEGEPVGKGRPRFSRRCGHIVTYTPAATENYEAWAKLCGKQAMAGREPISGPVAAEILFGVSVPKSWPAWRQEAALDGAVFPIGKPDCDNLIKAIFDALNGIVWRDDSQIVRAEVSKVYAIRPGALVTVREIRQVSSSTEWKLKQKKSARLAAISGMVA